MKQKGFTMVELLAAIAILALLVVMAFPTMRALQGRNEKQKYEEYGKSMVSAAKLYTDSYAEDLFPREYKNEFAIISSEDLEKKDLLKKIGYSDVSCISEDSVIVVAKYGADYQYCLSMKCKNKSGNVVYEESNREGICKTYDTREITYVYNSPNGVRKYVDKIIKGDDAYHALNPSNFGNFDFASNHQVFENWKVQGKNKYYDKGALVDYTDLNDNLVLEAKTRPFRYKVIYQGNGSTSGSVDSHPCDYGSDCILMANGYKKIGSTYLNWKDGNNKIYNPNQKYQNLVETDGGSITLSANWRLNKIYILYNANGGQLANQHLKDFTIKSDLIYKNNDSKFFSVSYGEQLGVNGLVDYNNPQYINLEKSGYKMQAGQEWNTASNGTGTSFDHSVRYKASDFCDASNGDCTRILYANWKQNRYTITLGSNFDGISKIYLGNNNTTSGKISLTVDGGTSVKIKADKSQYYKFKGWKDASGNTISSKLSDTITVTQNLNLTGDARLSKIYVIYDYNGGILKPGKMQVCPIQAGCKKNECVWKDNNHTQELGGCTRGECVGGKTCYKTPGADDYGYDKDWATEGLRNYSDSKNASIYLVRDKKTDKKYTYTYTPTHYWYLNKNGTGNKIKESTPLNSDHNTGLLLLNTFYPDGSKAEELKNNDVTIRIYAGWEEHKKKRKKH